jgi:hypothetical protein
MRNTMDKTRAIESRSNMLLRGDQAILEAPGVRAADEFSSLMSKGEL